MPERARPVFVPEPLGTPPAQKVMSSWPFLSRSGCARFFAREGPVRTHADREAEALRVSGLAENLLEPKCKGCTWNANFADGRSAGFQERPDPRPRDGGFRPSGLFARIVTSCNRQRRLLGSSIQIRHLTAGSSEYTRHRLHSDVVGPWLSFK